MSIKEIIKAGLGEKCFGQLATLKSRMNVSRNRLMRAFSKPRKSHPDPVLTTYSVPNAHTFFGYYDVIPFSGDDARLLAMVTTSTDHDVSARQEIRLGYFNVDDPQRFVAVAQTPTWCWQMGCRLQWHPSDPNRIIFYNTLVNGQYGAVLQDILSGKIERQLDSPIYALDSSGRHGLSLNFSRLQRLRPGYGYRNLPDATRDDPCPGNDGIWRIDMLDNRADLIIDLSRLSRLDPPPTMNGAQHYVNHLSFNPSGSRFMFFHLWEAGGKRYNRMITSDLQGQNLCVLENEGTSSHYTWKNETELLATVHYGKAGTRYNLYGDGMGLKTVVAQGLLTKDGHPSYSPIDNFLLTDTYPDKYREQHVLLLTADERLFDLTRIYSPPEFKGETRCDLHPRWSRQGRAICVDETDRGLRELAVLGVETGLAQ